MQKIKTIFKNKKAVSEVVVTLLMILLTISAVIILVFSLKKSVEPLLSPKQCLDMQINPQITIQKSCYNATTQDLEITLYRENNNKIDSLYFITQSQGEASLWCCGSQCPQCIILEEGTKTYYLSSADTQEIPEKVSLKVNNCILEAKDVGIC